MATTILVVDDDSYIRQYLTKRLTTLGYTVLQAEDGVEGLEVARKEMPDLIISDWMMPRMDGMELCRSIKNDDHLRFTYLIILTAKDTQDEKIAGIEQGADDYLTKPFNERELFARIKVGVRISQLQKELSTYQHQKAVTELAITIGHEINNPLGIVMLTLQVMNKKIDQQKFTELPKDITVCLSNGKRVADIVKKLCAIEVPQFKPYLKNSDVNMIDLNGKQ